MFILQKIIPGLTGTSRATVIVIIEAGRVKVSKGPSFSDRGFGLGKSKWKQAWWPQKLGGLHRLYKVDGLDLPDG